VSRIGIAIVVAAQFAALIAVSLLVGDNGWDDGAITLAFSRTFAHHGLVALTPYSETVEGFSSVSWFLLNALAALARPSYHASILISQVLSALCIAATTALLARTCALLRLDRWVATLTVITFAAWGCSFSEASNGMEMGLLAAACLIMVNELLLPQPRLLPLGAGAVLAVTTRFEAVFYVALLALSVASVPGRRAFWGLVITCLGTVVLLSGWRLAVFSDLLPNTFWAKRWPPYAAFGLVSRLRGALELPSLWIVPVIALVILRRSGFDLAGAWQTRRRVPLILGLPILGAVLMGGLIGKPWGYYGRMPYFAFPLVLLLFSVVLSSWVSVQRSTFRIGAVAALYAASIGLSMTGFPFGSLGAAFKGGSFGVTPHTYAESGRVFRRFASAADLQHPIILTPDVGGLALCCDEFRVVDLAFLSNRRLAHRGHVALAEVLETESPEMIEAHWRWASAGRLYDVPYFRAHYLPAFAGGTRFWIRRDVAKAIEGKGRGCLLAGAALDRGDVQEALRANRYATHDLPEDRTTFAQSRLVFALNQADPTVGNLCAPGPESRTRRPR
jgi:hypothetical protein